MDIAIIGTGISGLACAHLLQPHHSITLYEKNAYVGGHSRTIEIAVENGKKIPVDTGFIVLNDRNYPHLTGLFKTLGVALEKSDMSFGVCIDQGWLEYSSSAVFAQKRNIFRPSYWRMLFDIVCFKKKAEACLDKNNPTITLGAFLDNLKLGTWFKHYYLLAMGAAIWSCPVETILKFPARSFLQFFKNHGLLSIRNQPQWYSVKGGSREYVARLSQNFASNIKTSCAVRRVRFEKEKIHVTDEQGETKVFDHVIFACHADEALALIDSPAVSQKDILSSFTYQDNLVVVHHDVRFLPRNQKCWASWVYLSDKGKNECPKVSLSYWMNNLQNLETAMPVIITLNPPFMPQEDLIVDQHIFSHPVFDFPSVTAQEKMRTIQGKNNMWFCGAYQRYGFHEDGILSAVNVANAFGADIPWM